MASFLGFMITLNPIDEEQKGKGMKDASFVMMIMDDNLQVAAKEYVYSNCLPEHISKSSIVC
jgi:hypothetical protein